MKTFAAAFLSLAFLAALPGAATAAADSTPSKATRTPAKTATAPARKVRSVVLRKAAAPVIPAVPTFGQVAGLHQVDDPLALKSSVAYVLDQDTNEVLFSKNPQAVLPIASITKLMTALVVVEAGLSLDEKITVTDDDIDTEKFTRSRLAVGTTLTRGEMLHLALMASENRAAHALGRNYPGGLEAFVDAMNAKAQTLGMSDTHYVEPTGLSSRNQSSAADLAKLVNVTSQVPLLRDLSTSREARVALGKRLVQFRSTNGLLSNPLWDIGLQKTGFINEAGKCLVMQASMAGRKLIMVFLDSSGKASRIADAERMRKWLATVPDAGQAATASTKL
ncbi:D-alanyl-D-alanine endopeptidase (penicillin-binding protein 7) [Pelomonas saccharophila]|uniref:D-alanyl-D-alanine endopeptidase (Penicillin-binding protein 7) n=1 Tax=Roseateles saccharophilus TaxID=304 RepID=A0ABU1YHU9_ROSSA|nr:D-alanyl-D-alanine endopeptidase [Roseateles saccharophilus]MDR7268429.1 D-alanyl-D-alanine endopeptidase (penicillin-binding protein 7) [Roseateles saccharophilus]